MELFSQRKGIKPIKNIMQVDSMDEDLRNSLWNALTIYYWNQVSNGLIEHCKDIHTLCKVIWMYYFKKPIDSLLDYWNNQYNRTGIYHELRNYFYSCTWYEVYDFIEFIANNFVKQNDRTYNQRFKDFCNTILESEVSAYRFVGGKITQITSETEINEIESAIAQSINPVATHLNQALDLLADRTNPDYRNSIKESISAVESLCGIITNNPNGTLGQTIKEVEKKINLHSAFKDAISKLYGWTSDGDGIRHSLMEESNVNFEDAKFMLVSCSAFVNYLTVKASKAGIKL